DSRAKVANVSRQETNPKALGACCPPNVTRVNVCSRVVHLPVAQHWAWLVPPAHNAKSDCDAVRPASKRAVYSTALATSVTSANTLTTAAPGCLASMTKTAIAAAPRGQPMSHRGFGPASHASPLSLRPCGPTSRCPGLRRL